MGIKVKIMKKTYIKIIFSAFVTSLLACSVSKSEYSAKASKNNIILIVADDLGWSDLGCYGNRFIETPNLDKLAKSGLMFNNAYAAAPLCSPSRASIISGNNPSRINLTEHLHGYTPPTSAQKIVPPRIAPGLPPETTTIAESLKTKDYHTAHFGKWHLGSGLSSPINSGFDLVYGGGEEGLPKSFFYPFFWGKPYQDLLDDSKEGDYLDDKLTDKAISYISEKKDDKFFIELNFYSPHVPIEGKPDLVKKYTEKKKNIKGKPLNEPEYAAMVDNIDYNVGRLLQHLKATGLDKHTMIIFVSDNGGLTVKEVKAFAKHTPPTSNNPLKGGKGSIYEGGIRVPFIISRPGLKKNGEINQSALVTTDDIFNTCMQAVNSTEKSPDGLNIFDNKGLIADERILFWHFPHYSPQRGMPGAAVRYKEFKMIEWYETGKFELYNLENDIGENQDIADKSPEMLNYLKEKLTAWRKNIGVTLPAINPKYKSPN
jgi:arylsulfatase A